MSVCSIIVIVIVIIIIYSIWLRANKSPDKVIFYTAINRFSIAVGKYVDLDLSRVIDVYIPKGIMLMLTNVPDDKKIYETGYKPKNLDTLMLSGPSRHILYKKCYKLVECSFIKNPSHDTPEMP